MRPALEVLESRITPTGNIAVTGASVVNSNNQPLATVNVGDWVSIQTNFTTLNLPINASYRVATAVNGLTLDSGTLTWGAGNSGTGSWDFVWGAFLATSGINQVTVTVDPDNSVAETSYADNTISFTFNAVSPASSSFISYTAAQMRNAYGVNSIPDFGSATPDGSGQTIAIINGGNDPSLFADVDGFDQSMSLTTTSTKTIYQGYGAASSFLTVYNQNGVNITSSIANSGSNGVPALPATSEESWDVEWAHAMAPGAKIVEIEFDDTGNWGQNVLTSYALAATLPGVTAVNWSGGLGQSSNESADDSSIFVTPNGHPGVTFVDPSNDNGANVYPFYGQGDGYYPSTSPNVLSVGGTSLTVNDNGYGGETGWSFPTPTTTIDNGSASYSQTGSWSSQTGGFSGTVSTAAAGNASTATWTIPVNSSDTGWGTELSTTWNANSGNASNATYTVYDGKGTSGTVLGTITMNQTVAPVGTADGSSQFQELGVFFPTVDANGNGTLTVVLNAQSANGTVVADAIGAAPAWASTGGPALFESEPSYQMPFQSTGFRTTPDVAFDADFSADGFSNGAVTYGGGGTSLGGPAWAGLIAVINQGRVAAGGAPLNSPSDPQQTQQAIYSLPATDFHDITTGYNGLSAGPGYDEVTGRGSPIANLLVPDMVAYDLPVSLQVTVQPPSTVGKLSAFTFDVAAEYPNGTVDTTFNGPVTISIATEPGTGALNGTLIVNAVNGIATFSPSITGAGTGYSLTATAGGFLSATTATFTVANPIIVTTLSDTETAGQTTLRDAINAADADTGMVDVINFAPGLFANNTAGTITLTQGALIITNSMSIIGPGANLLTISGNGASRVFTIDDGSAVAQNVTISGVTITDGTGVAASNTGAGGAVFNQESLTLSNDVISNSTATEGGAVWTNGALVTSDVTFSGNGADFGANIWNNLAPALPGNANIASSIVGSSGTVYDLTTTGVLYAWTGTGNWMQLASNVSSFQVGPNDMLHVLQPGGNLYARAGVNGAWLLVNLNDSEFEVGLDGTLYVMQPGGTVYAQTSPNGVFTQLGTNDSSILLGSDGAVYALQPGGSLYGRMGPNGGWTFLNTNDSSVQVGPGGLLYVLQPGGSLYSRAGLSGGWSAVSTNVSSFQVAPDGTLYILQPGGNLSGRLPATSAFTQISSNDSSFQVASDGTVYVLQPGGNLYDRAGLSGTWAVLNSGDSSFQLGPNGMLYVLQTGGNLSVKEGLNASFLLLNSNDSSFQVAVDGTIYVIQPGGNLYARLGVVSNWMVIGTSETSFQVGPEGTIYVLQSNGILYSRPGLVNNFAGLTSNVIWFEFTEDGTLYFARTGGSLSSWTGPNGVLTQFMNAASSYAISSDGTFYALQTNGAFFALAGAINSLTLVNTNDSSFQVGPEGTVYILQPGGNLYKRGGLNGVFALLASNVNSYQLLLDGTLDINGQQVN